MRFLVAQPGPAFSVHDVYVGWVEALRAAGHQVVEFPFADVLTFYGEVFFQVTDDTFRRALDSDSATAMATDRLCAALYKVRPDVLLTISGFFLPHQLLDTARMYGTKVVVRHTECPYEDQRQIELAAHADLNLLSDPTNLERFKEVAPSVYMPQAYRPALHKPGRPDPTLACDFAFVGTGYPSRCAFFEAMDLDGLDVILGGNWQHCDEHSPLRRYVPHDIDECLDNEQTVAVYQSAKVGMNLYRREAETDEQIAGWAIGPREVEMAACELFFLRDPRPETDEVLGMLPAFTTPGEASDLLRWWLKRPDERQELARQAHAAVADRTFDQHAAQLLRLLT